MLPEFDPVGFCDALQGNVLFVGDSLTLGQYDVLKVPAWLPWLQRYFCRSLLPFLSTHFPPCISMSFPVSQTALAVSLFTVEVCMQAQLGGVDSAASEWYPAYMEDFVSNEVRWRAAATNSYVARPLVVLSNAW